jgi:hypothetical protein
VSNSRFISEAVREMQVGETRTPTGVRLTKHFVVTQSLGYDWTERTLVGVLRDTTSLPDLCDVVVSIQPPKRGFSTWQEDVTAAGRTIQVRRASAALFVPRLLPFNATLPEDVLLGELQSTGDQIEFLPVASLCDPEYGDAVTEAVLKAVEGPMSDQEWAQEHCFDRNREGLRVLTELAVDPYDDWGLTTRVEDLVQGYQF